MPMREFAMRFQRVSVGACVILVALLCVMPASVGAQAAGAPPQKNPDVMTVEVRSSGAERFDFAVAVSSPYDIPKRYADAFRVSAKDGAVFGEGRLLHDHADEQAFTRDLHGVTVPRGVRVVVVQARDSAFGYGGKTVEVVLPGRN